MAKSIKTMVMILMGIITVLSCSKEDDNILGLSGNYKSSPVIEKVPMQNDEEIKGFTYNDQRMRFVEEDLENSFRHDTLTNKRLIQGIRVSERFNLNAKGTVHYIEPKTERFSETEGTRTETKGEEIDRRNGWFETPLEVLQNWNATNTDDATDCPHSYRDSIWVSSTNFVFVPADSLQAKGINGYVAEFPAVEVEVKAGEKKTEEVSGVVYNGKTWEALKVSYPSVVTLIIPEDFRMEGEDSEMTLDVVNVVYYLRHVVNTVVDDTDYKVNIIEDGLAIYKTYQTVNFNIVTRDNGEVKESNSYKLEEAFDITAVEVEDVEVFSEEALKNTKVTFSEGEITGKPEVEDIFTKTVYTGTDNVVMTDGRSTKADISYASYAWGEVQFPYASVVSRKAELKSEMNETLSSSAKKVYDVTLTLTYTVTYNNSDKEDETKVITIFYKRFMKVDNFETRLENLVYKVNILDGESIYKEYQTINFDIVLRNNGEVVESTPYELEEAFDITAVEVEDVEVFSEEALKNTKVTFTEGEIKGSTKAEDIFTKTTYTGSDKASMTDGRSTDVAISYEGYAWGEVQFPYASVIGRKAELKSVKNSKETTAAKVVYDVTLTLTYTVAYNNSNKKSEDKVIVITYKRFYNVPDDFKMSVTAENFDLQYEQPDESEMGSKVERNTVHVVETNRGEVEKDFTYNHDIALSSKMKLVSDAKVKVEDVKALTAKVEPNGGYKTTYGKPDAYGVQTVNVTRKYNVKVSDGSTYELVITDERARRGGEDFGHHAEFNDAAFQPIIATQPTLNLAASSTTEKVYDVKVSVRMPINRTDKVATKAAGNEADVFTVSASHQETVEVKDEYVPEKDRTVWSVVPNGNGFDINGYKYETYTLSGEIEVDHVSERVKCSVKGVNGSMKTVKNVNYVTNGNGHNGTGSGVYTNNADNTVSADAFVNEYTWSADGAITLTLKGKGGPNVSKTFNPTFVITEGAQNISQKSEEESYIAYDYKKTVDAVYGLEGQTVKLSATDTRELRVEKEIDILVGDLIAAGMSVVPGHWTGSEYVDGNGTQQAILNLTLIKKDGSAAPIVYVEEIPGTCQLPTDDQIKSAKWFSGSYTEEYNSALYTDGQWVPAIARDNYGFNGISYSAPEYGKARSIRNETLNEQWHWRGGNLSAQAPYEVSVKDGVCTIKYDGKIVKQFR